MRLKDCSKIGKQLGAILRHRLIELNLAHDSYGYVLVDDMFSTNLIKRLPIEDIIFIVENDNKNRFYILVKENKCFIRDNQGHSLEAAKFMDDCIASTIVLEPLLKEQNYNFLIKLNKMGYVE